MQIINIWTQNITLHPFKISKMRHRNANFGAIVDSFNRHTEHTHCHWNEFSGFGVIKSLTESKNGVTQGDQFIDNYLQSAAILSS
jgi:hypothetical protein